MANNADCPRCRMEETTLHAVRDCDPIRRAWQVLGENSLVWMKQALLEVRLGAWKRRMSGWIKLNVDRASKGNSGNIRGGGIFHDEQGMTLNSIMFREGYGTALKAELLACMHGLKVAKYMGFPCLMLKTDSLVGYRLLHDRNKLTHPDFYLLKRCWELLNTTDMTITIHHIPRQCNRVADGLAQLSFFGPDVFSSALEHPVNIFPLLDFDSMYAADPVLLPP
ncbi:hypothetical protein V2J09_006549 [Rumex salicifolius]